MIPDIISVSKSLSCRLQEFENLLSDEETPCSEINDVWASIFQILVIPKCGWEALWLMSEKSCLKYDVMHPTAIIVTASPSLCCNGWVLPPYSFIVHVVLSPKVDSYDWDELTATVTVTGIQDDIILPSAPDVPVIELHPIKNQEYDEDDLKVIADWLDKCRYFFKYLWYPWDEKEKVRVSDWCSSHLNKRLKLQCDIQNGVISKKIANYHKSLVTESHRVHEALSEFDEDDVSPNQSITDLKNCFRRKILKLELDLLECPEIRNDLMVFRFGNNWDKDCKKEAKFVWEGGSIGTLLLHLSAVKSQIENDTTVKVSPSLQEALDGSSAGVNIFLPPGSHVLTNLAGLESGGTIKGLGNSEETKMLDDSSCARRAILFSCWGDFKFQNVTILRQEGIAVQIFEKTLKFSNCSLKSGKSASARGVIVLSDCTLIMEDCVIDGFGVGIVLKKGSKAFISNTTITHCFIGMKVGEDMELSMHNVKISNCTKSAVCLESTENSSDLPKFGELDLLLVSCGDKVTLESVELKDNKSNVMIADSLDGFALHSNEVDRTHETITLTDDSMEDCSH